jgi:hypothetical protein
MNGWSEGVMESDMNLGNKLNLNKILADPVKRIKGEFSLFGVVVIVCYTALVMSVIGSMTYSGRFDISALIAVFVLTAFMFWILLHYVSRSSGYSLSKALEEHDRRMCEMLAAGVDAICKTICDIKTIGEGNGKNIIDLTKNISKTLALTSLAYRGETRINDMNEFYKIWTEMMSKSTVSFYAVNYLDVRSLDSGDFTPAAAALLAQKKFHEVRVHRVYFVDDDNEIPAVVAAAKANRSDGYSASYIKISDLVKLGVFTKCGFSSSEWNRGFVIIDGMAVAIFKMENRVPISFEISVDQHLVDLYQKLFDLSEGYAEKQLID